MTSQGEQPFCHLNILSHTSRTAIIKLRATLRQEKKNLGKVETKKFNLWFKSNHVLKDVDFQVKENAVTAIMGPSGCGKSTLLRSINRMNDLINGCRTSGEIMVDGQNIYGEGGTAFMT